MRVSDLEHGAAIAELERRLGHTFSDRAMLRQALMHRSYASEQEIDESYERLEFLGDAVIQLAVTRYLFDQHGELAEGEMAKVRASVVSEKALAAIGGELAVGSALLLGKGEDMSGGRAKASLVSDVVEALFGALFLEAGYAEAEVLVLRHWRARVDERAEAPGLQDYKTRLQEALARYGRRPKYVVVEEKGPDHDKEFTVEIQVGSATLGRGTASSKKRADQSAAREAAFELPRWRIDEQLRSHGVKPKYVVAKIESEAELRYRAEVLAGDHRLGVGTGTTQKRARQAAADAALAGLSEWLEQRR